jgi:hypothetical protein
MVCSLGPSFGRHGYLPQRNFHHTDARFQSPGILYNGGEAIRMGCKDVSVLREVFHALANLVYFFRFQWILLFFSGFFLNP